MASPMRRALPNPKRNGTPSLGRRSKSGSKGGVGENSSDVMDTEQKDLLNLSTRSIGPLWVCGVGGTFAVNEKLTALSSIRPPNNWPTNLA